MPRRISSFGVGANPELEQAFLIAQTLKPGEAILIPCDSKEDVERLRRYFFRLRKRAQSTNMVAGVADPNEADPWRGLITQIHPGPPALEIKRPRKIGAVVVVREDGSREEVKL